MTLLGFNLFQIVFLFVDGLLFCASIVAASRGKVSRRDGLLWSTLCLAAGLAVLWPRITELVADALGIGRGADLILYFAVAIMMAGFWKTYLNLRMLRREVTVLVRHIALLEAERRDEEAHDSTEETSSGPPEPPRRSPRPSRPREPS